MKKIFTLAIMYLTFINVSNATDNSAYLNKLNEETNKIAQQLSLDEYKTKQVFNVVKHFNERIEDLELGTDNYDRLAKYIAQERDDMMQSALTVEEYKKYNELYKNVNSNEIEYYMNKNKEYVNQNPIHKHIAYVAHNETLTIF